MSGPGNLSWGGSRSVSHNRTWQASGSGEAQLHRPATAQDRQIREASGRALGSVLDGFQNLGQNAFGGASFLMQSLASGRTPDMAGFLQAARFNPADLSRDLRKISGELSKNPVDTIQNMILGAPTGAIDRTLKSVEGGLQQLENATGLKKEFSGSTSKQIGDFREFQFKKQLGEMGTLSNQTKTKLGADFNAQGDLKVGLAGASGQGSFAGSAGGSVESHSRYEGVLGSATNSTSGYAGVQYGGQGSFKAGVSGIEAQGSAGVRGGAGVSTQGRLENAFLGSLDYQGKAGVEAYANVQGQGTLDARGLNANVKGEIGVSASVEAAAQYRSPGIMLGGERLDLNAQGRVRATAEAKAEGTAQVSATINPPRAVVDIGGKAFAGVKAEAEGSVGIGGFATLSGRVGAWAGAGAEGGVKFGYDDGKLKFGFGGGAAVGYGFGGSWGVEIDVKKMANAAIGTGIEVASKGIEYALDPTAALRDGIKAVENIDKTVNKAVEMVDKTVSSVVQGAAEAVGKTVGSVVKGATDAIKNVVGMFKFW